MDESPNNLFALATLGTEQIEIELFQVHVLPKVLFLIKLLLEASYEVICVNQLSPHDVFKVVDAISYVIGTLHYRRVKASMKRLALLAELSKPRLILGSEETQGIIHLLLVGIVVALRRLLLEVAQAVFDEF